MRNGVLVVMVVALLVSGFARPPAAEAAPVDKVEDFGSVLAVAMPEDFPIASLMRANCSFVIRVERPDGSATETMKCELSDEPVMIPAFQGVPPDTAFVLAGGACTWISDYWGNTEGIAVYAESFRYTVTPSGQVLAESTYPAVPLDCE